VARLVAVSRPLAEVAAGLGVPRERIAVVENGVDRRLFFPADRSAARRELGLPAGARIILYVGRLEREKGVADLLEAFPRVATALPESVLVIVGDGGLRSRCEEAAARGGRVVCAGPRPLEDVPRWLAACDVLTLPSWNEGTPNVLLEALAAGRRVVASRVGGIPDVIRNAELGELVPPRDVPILAATLARALVAPYDPNALAAAAPHDWSQSAAALLGVLREAVGPAARA
jgi:glycosyltransferase involved in cell wall biosynthesis